MAPPKAINHMVLTGNVGKDPMIQNYTNQRTGNEDIVVDLSLALYGGKVNPDDKDPKAETFTKWMNVRFRGSFGGEKRSLAEEIADSIKKGDRICVSGRPTFYIARNEDKSLKDHKDNDNVRMTMEATDIVVLDKPVGGGKGGHELPPI